MGTARSILAAALVALSLTHPARGQVPEIGRGEVWPMTRILADGTTEAAGEALALDGFSGPVTFLHLVAGAHAVQLETPSGPIEVGGYLTADVAHDLVVLEPLEGLASTPWPGIQPATLERDDELSAYAASDAPVAVTTQGWMEVPPGLTLLHLDRSPRGPAPVFDGKGRFVALGGHFLAPDGILAYGIGAEVLVRLQRRHRGEALARPLSELAGEEAPWRDAKTAAGLCLRGGLMVRNQQILEGLAYLERALETAPGASEIQFEIGSAYAIQMSHATALEAFRKAVAGRPCYVEALVYNGATCFNLNLYDEAESLYAAAMACDSTYARIHVNVGGLAHMRRRNTEAEAAFRKAIALDPEFDVARFNLAVLLKRTGRPDQALEQLNVMRANGSALALRLQHVLEGL